jgi:hypothetical protein
MNQQPANTTTSFMAQLLLTKRQVMNFLCLRFAHLRFAFKNHRLPIILTGLFVAWIFIDCLTDWQHLHSLKNRWNTDIDQIVSLATLMTALFVWYGEMAEDWKNNLPKRLTVRFETEDGNLVMLCIKAHLSDVADIRALGQQIGLQICGETSLAFRAPLVKWKNPETIPYDPEIGYFLHYEVTFTLTERPGTIPKGCKIWKTPFGKNDLTFKSDCSNATQ